MATNKLQWKRIAKGDKFPCQSFLRKKNGEMLKLSTVGGVKVGQDCYYLPVDEVINVIKDYPVAESEDERIRKELIKQVVYIVPNDDETDNEGNVLPIYQQRIDKYIAWLEKQGQTFTKKDIDDAYIKGICDAKKELEQQGEQKDILEDATLDNNEDGLIADTIKAKGKPKPWSEDDEAILSWCISDIERAKYCRSQTKPELCDIEINWLKNIKDRVLSQSFWKPSDEQMNALNYVVNLMASSERPTENDLYYNILKSLIQQLMKLKG